MNKKRRGIFGVVITIVLLIILVFVSNININKFSHIKIILSSKIIMPIQSGITYLKNKFAGNENYFATMDYLKQKNEELIKQNIELEGKLRQLEIIRAENSTLKEYLKLTDQYKGYETIPAYIINKDISNYSSIFVINVGTDNGIKENMTVIAEEGLVGHIISVSKETAKVQTLIDSSNVVSATLENSKDTVICRGTLNGKELRSNYISTNTVLIEGEKLYTSGIGGIYPKGIYIGNIKKINETKNITDRSFITEAAVDFENLETVLVISK